MHNSSDLESPLRIVAVLLLLIRIESKLKARYLHKEVVSLYFSAASCYPCEEFNRFCASRAHTILHVGGLYHIILPVWHGVKDFKLCLGSTVTTDSCIFSEGCMKWKYPWWCGNLCEVCGEMNWFLWRLW